VNDDRRDLVRTVLAVLFIAALIVSMLWILRPFLLALVWATAIVTATWPLMLRVESRLGGRRGATVAVMVLVMLLAFILPLALAVGSIASHVDTIVGWVTALPEISLPPAPAWVSEVPLAGERIAAAWDGLAAAGTEAIFARLAPYSGKAAAWLWASAGGVGAAFLHILLTIVIAAILYAHGERAAEDMRRFGRRLAGERGERMVLLAAQSVRAVALGVIVTALVQSALAGVGLALAGIPFAMMLTGVAFLLCIAQLGPLPVLVPAVIWLYSTGRPGWGTALLVWSVFVGTFDNFLRPWLIKRGANLSLLLIFAGVIGGLVAFGVVGLFVGPVVLAVGYTLFTEWVSAEPDSR
jgi:predicted PurR-regulated permease PerM